MCGSTLPTFSSLLSAKFINFRELKLVQQPPEPEKVNESGKLLGLKLVDGAAPNKMQVQLSHYFLLFKYKFSYLDTWSFRYRIVNDNDYEKLCLQHPC